MSDNIGLSQPISASSFTNSIGINTHLDFSFIPAYQNLPMVENNLIYLGVKNVRDSAQTASDAALWQQVAQATGVKFDDYIPETSQAGMQAALGFMPQLAKEGILNFVEGGDEEDDSYPQGLGNTLAATATVQQQLWTLGNQLGLPVINMSFGSGWTAANNWQGDYGAAGNLSAYTTYGNAHTYPSGAPDGSMQQINGLAQIAAPGKPVITTEIGWNTSSTTPITAAKYTLDAALDGMLNGDVKTYFYSLYNDNSGNWGLFNSNGTPQPSAIALHDLMTLLNDPGANAATFKPTALSYALSGTAAGDKSLLLEKSDGTYWLALWNEQQALNTSHTVTLTLSGAASEVEIFDPLTGITALQTYHNTASVQVTVPDHPVLVEIIGAAAAVTTPTTTATPTPVSPNPVITTPVSETMTVGTTINLSGISLSDPWAANNPGQLVLNLSATDGTLWMTDTTGTTISGSGTNYITVSGSLAQLDADLTNLKFSGTTSGGYGLVSVNVFDQAGAQAIKILGITINAAPTITLGAPILNETVVAGQSLSNLWSQIVGNGTDSVSSNTLSVTSLGTSGTIGKVALNTATDTVDYTAGAYTANTPVDSFTYTLSDGQGGISTGTVDVTITAPPAATIASALPAAVTIDVTNVGKTAYAPSQGWELNSQALGQTLVSSAQGEDVLSGGGDTNFLAQGLGNIVAGTTGNHSVFANAGNTEINFSGGNNNIVGLGSGDIITTGSGNNFVWGPSGDTTITMGDGNQNINLSGAGNKVSVGTGNELIDAGSGGGESVAINGGSGQVSAGGLGDNININSGNFTVTSYTGQDTIEAGSGNEAIYAAGNTNVIAMGNGNSTIDALGNDNSISVGSGTDTLNLNGTGTSVDLGSGNYKISDSGNGNTFSFNGRNSTANITVNGGDTVGLSNGGNKLSINSGGNSTIYAGVGGSNTITVGAGNDIIDAFGSHNSITLGSGNDALTFSGSNNTILLGSGNATLNDSGSGNTIVLNGASQGIANIYGYVLQDGETFDLSKVLAQTNWNHDLASVGNYIKVSSNSYESTIAVDQSGQPGGVTQTVAVLRGEGYLNLNGLLSHSVT